MSLLLNGFRLSLSESAFKAYAQDVPESASMRDLRAVHTDWFLSWRGGKVYGLPKMSQPATNFGQPIELECTDNIALEILAARINSLLPTIFPQYNALYRRPFAFLGQKDELVSATLAQLKMRNIHRLVRHFSIRPKFELDTRLIELCDGELNIALVMSVGMKWEIEAPVSELHKEGIDLTGQHIIRRNPTPEQRRLVGKIGSVQGRTIGLTESYDGQIAANCDEVWLEGNTSSFYRCLRHLLGRDFDQYDKTRFVKESEFLTGPALEKLLQRMGQFLANARGLQITVLLPKIWARE